MDHQRGQTDAESLAGAPEDVHRALRAWARGGYSDEAAVELIIRAFDGRFARPGWPWIKPLSRGGYWLDGEAITENAGALSGGEQRLLAVVASLASYQPPDRGIGQVMNCDRDNQELILAALSHAGGSQEHRDFVRDESEAVALGPLHAWPRSELVDIEQAGCVDAARVERRR